ncbi:MAG: tetratricopeptide repeat protein [Phycisphaerae bacterium]
MQQSIRVHRFITLVAVCTLAIGVWLCGNRANAQEAPPLAKEIQQRAAAIRPNDAAGHQKLALFLYNHKLYDQALAQVNAALKIQPNLQNAQLLKNLIQIALRQQPAAQGPNSPTAPSYSSSSAPSPTTAGRTLLSMNDVYKIRFWQLQRHETAPIEATILHRRKTLMSFWRNIILRNPMYQNTTLTRRDYEQFISPSNLNRQIYLIRRLGTAKYWDKVQIKSDPQVLKIFRTDIQPIVLQSCGTIGCHRGQNAPGFRIYSDEGPGNVRNTYTNFITLTRFQYHNRPLISLHNPRMSLLLQYLRPKELQAYSHPGKKGPKPLRFNENRVLNWIESLRYPPHSYGLSHPAAATPSSTTGPTR